MSQSYLFLLHSNLESTLSIRLSEEGEIEAPLLHRSPEEYQAMCLDTSSVIVLPAHWVSLHQVTLPKISPSKIKTVLPYALEDELAQPIEEVHIAISPSPTAQLTYNAIVIDKAKFQNLLSLLNEHQIPVNSITLDWYALSVNEAFTHHEKVLIKNEEFSGGWETQCPLHLEEYSTLNTLSFNTDEEAYLWLAKRLNATKPLNLCQGEFRLKTTTQSYQRWYHIAALLGMIWGLTYFALHGAEIFYLNQQLKNLETQNLKLYQSFFPDATQMVNPRFRISALLSSANQSKDQTFWSILKELDTIFKTNTYTLIELKWRANALTMTFQCPDFRDLETFQNELEKTGIHVNQIQANTEDERVLATLELSR